jgi:serine/threonine-protein kinase RsbW
MTQSEPSTTSDEVELRIPAAMSYVSTLRSLTAGLAARCDLTLDQIEDLRIAVDEACALLLPHALDGADITARFRLAPGLFEVTAAVPALDAAEPDREGFAWTVLAALAEELTVDSKDGELSISLRKHREALAQ